MRRSATHWNAQISARNCSSARADVLRPCARSLIGNWRILNSSRSLRRRRACPLVYYLLNSASESVMLCITWIRLSYRTVFRTLSLGTDLSRYFIRDRVGIRNMTQIPQSAPHVLILLFSDYCRIFLGLLSFCQRYSL